MATLRAEWPKDFCSIPTRGKVDFSCSKPSASYLTGTGVLPSAVTQPRRKADKLPHIDRTSRMRGDMSPLPPTPSRCDASLKAEKNVIYLTSCKQYILLSSPLRGFLQSPVVTPPKINVTLAAASHHCS